jgi:hypothetical protein
MLRLASRGGFLICLSILLCAPALPLDSSRSGNLGAVDLDGRVDEPAWQDASLIAELVQQSPHPKQPTPYRTAVRVLVSPDTIYFGFECADPAPHLIAVHTMQRDGNLEGDDSVSVVLDTYGDRRTGYFFKVNAAGARVDGLIAGAESPSRDWDGIWEARTARSDSGWSAEIAIPARTLNFKAGLSQWGANFERRIPRDLTVLRWASPTLDSFLYDLSRSGTLAGVERLRQGVGLEVSPYVVGRMKNYFQDTGRQWQGTGGGDVTYRVTPQLAAVLTVNTDFAETEVDARQLNLTRFPLFFPERRQFFLEASNQFQFGLGLDPFFIPFFSRRVGLFEGAQIPLNAGLKVIGRAGRMNVGLLDVGTRDTSPRGMEGIVPGANLFAGRVSYDVSPRLRVGTIVTNGHPDGVSRNSLVGFDAVWTTSKFMGDKNFMVGGWTAATGGDRPPGGRTGWGFKVDYPNDLWDCFVSINEFGEALNPGLGFLPRPGVRRYDASCEYKPRPKKDGRFGWIRQQFMEHRFYRVVNYRGELESQRFFWAPVNIRLESGDRFEFNWVPWYEYLPEPFEIADGVILPVGSYRFDRFRLEFETAEHRPWEFGNTTWFGTFYNGHLLEQENYLRYTSRSGGWQVGLESLQNFGDLPQGSFVQRLWQTTFAYSFNPNLVLTSYLQYDTESENIGNNMRLRWTIKPGNDLFIVWNRGWKRLFLTRDEFAMQPETELLAVKLRWTFRR